MELRGMPPECHDFVGKKKPTNLCWTAIMISFMLDSLVERANFRLQFDKRFKSVVIIAITGTVSCE